MKRFAPRRSAALLIAALMIGCGGTESNTPDGGAGRVDGTSAEGALDLADDGLSDRAEGTADGALSGRAARAPSDSAPEADRGRAEARTEAVPAPGSADTRSRSAGAEPSGTVLFIGTSLTAGLGLPEAQSFPLLIERRIEQAGLPFDVVNAGVSGETSAGALRRIDWLLRQDFDVVVLETGANDMLRGVDPSSTESNIQAIIDRLRDARPDVEIVLAGMRALPNMGEAYGREFEAIYPRLAERNDLPFVPFLLEDVGGVPELNQSDGVHPNAEGHRIVAGTVWEVLEPVLTEAAADEQAATG